MSNGFSLKNQESAQLSENKEDITEPSTESGIAAKVGMLYRGAKCLPMPILAWEGIDLNLLGIRLLQN
jgi:hypothetical protein